MFYKNEAEVKYITRFIAAAGQKVLVANNRVQALTKNTKQIMGEIMRIKNCFQEKKMFGQVMMIPYGIQGSTVNGVIRLNKPGYAIWKWIEEGFEEEEIIPKLAEKFKISTEKARGDVHGLIGQMRAAGVFEDDLDWQHTNLKDI